jgi:dipeptidyl aminopeptidase/acylaminoacyl peptidase
MRRIPVMAALTLSVLCALALDVPAQPHPFSVHDLVMMDRISSMTVSPDGRQIAFVVRETDLEANRGRTDLFVMANDGTALRRLTSHEAGEGNPVWAPDARTLYFLSTRSGSNQIWRIAVDGGEAQQVSDLPLDVSDMKLSPDGTRVAFAMEVFVDCETIACTEERLDARAKGKTTGQTFDRLFVRHWDGFLDGRRRHLFTAPLLEDGTLGEPVDMMAGMDADAPSRPFGGSEEYTFTPDGEGLVFAARFEPGTEAWSTDFDLYHVSRPGAEPVVLTDENQAWDTQPVFSPDGRTLAYKAMRVPVYEADRTRVVLRDWNGGRVGEARWLTEDWDRSVGSLSWTEDGKALLTHTEHLGRRALFRIDARTGAATVLVNEGAVGSEEHRNGRIYFTMDHFRSPVQIYSIRADGRDRKQLTNFNAERLAQVQFGEPEQITFTGANDATVYAWIVKPAGFDATKKYPVAFLVHGGPQGSFGQGFHYRWNPQTYAGAGYAVVMVDFHGSVGYGQAFTDAIQDNWGGWPLEDLQKGLAAALERYPWMDGDRVAALGASYGGYMINWIAGNWPDRFRCLVNHDGLFDLKSMYFSTEELWFPEREFLGTPWSSESYDEWNPAAHVDKWQTPMLVVHGERDYRVPVTEGLQTFTALQRRGIPSRLLYFPDENHFVLKPHNSIQWHTEVIGWIDRWTKAEGGAR